MTPATRGVLQRVVAQLLAVWGFVGQLFQVLFFVNLFMFLVHGISSSLNDFQTSIDTRGAHEITRIVRAEYYGHFWQIIVLNGGLKESSPLEDCASFWSVISELFCTFFSSMGFPSFLLTGPLCRAQDSLVEIIARRHEKNNYYEAENSPFNISCWTSDNSLEINEQKKRV